MPFALSTKRRRSSISRKLACLPARCQHRTRRCPEHHRCQPPLPPSLDSTTTTTHHRATLGTIPRANKRLPARSQLRTVSPARLPPTSFVASQTPARYAEPRCSHTCDDTIQRNPTEHQRASFRGSLSLRNTAAPLYSKWTTGTHHLSPLHRNHHLEPPSTHTLRWRERGTMISLYVYPHMRCLLVARRSGAAIAGTSGAHHHTPPPHADRLCYPSRSSCSLSATLASANRAVCCASAKTLSLPPSLPPSESISRSARSSSTASV